MTERKATTVGHPGVNLWTALWRQRVAGGLFLLGTVGYSALYNLVAKPVYETSTKIVFEESREPIPGFDLSEAFARKSYLVNQIEEVKTNSLTAEVAQALPPQVADTLLASLKPTSPAKRQENLVALIRRSLSAEPIRDSDVIVIRAQARSPMIAQVLANTCANVVEERNVSVKRAQASSTRKFIESQLPQIRAELGHDEEALMSFKARNQVVSLTDEARELLTRTTEIGTQYALAQAQRWAAQERLDALRGELAEQRASVVPSISTITSAWADSLRRGLVSLEVQYDNLLVKGYDQDHPEMTKILREIGRTKEKLSAEILRVAEGENLLDPMSQIANLSREALSQEIDIKADSVREASLRGVLLTYDSKMERLPDKELSLARLTRSQMVNENIYRMLLEKFEEARITEAGKIGNARILDPAFFPTSPVRPRKFLNLLMAVIVGSLGATFLATFLESLDRSLKTPEETEQLLAVPMVGLIPTIRVDGNHRGRQAEDQVSATTSRLVTQHAPRSPIAEAYRTLRTNLSFANLDTPLRTILVTSPISKDGKSTTVANLAITLAQAGMQTLLVDTDLRKPVLDELFGLKDSPGLTDVLVGKATLSSAVQKTRVEHLSLLATGPLPPNPSELLGSQKMGDLVAEAKRNYDMVLFDAPPVVVVTDAAVLVRWTDGVVLVVRNAETDRALALRAKELLENVRAKIVGTVMNDLKIERGYGGQKYYHYYYYHYYGNGNKKKTPKRTAKPEYARSGSDSWSSQT